MVTFTASHGPPDDGAQTQICANPSSPSSNHAVTVERAVATVGNTLGTDETGSLENSSTKQTAPADKADSKDEIHDKRNCDSIEDCLALLTFFQKPVKAPPLRTASKQAVPVQCFIFMRDLYARP